MSNGVAGDMLLGALNSAGVPLDLMSEALRPMGLPITLHAEEVTRSGLAATKVSVEVPDHDQPVRTWRDIQDLLKSLADPVGTWATTVFRNLAEAEAEVHGTSPDEVHFHEVGALDSIADVVASCAGLLALDLDELVVSPFALGGGTVRASHGTMPVPVPAVLALLRNARAPGSGGVGDCEMSTPTGVAIATAFATGYGPLPHLSPDCIGTGAGTRNPTDRPNVVRLVVGATTGSDSASTGTAVVLEANIDDMDPRLWPAVLAALLSAGAGDAWLVPIAMKKGRPAHTLCVLAAHERVAAVRAAIFAHTTTIGIRQLTVDKHALHREFRTVAVGGQNIAVKLGVLPSGEVVNAMPEWEDVARAAEAIARPVKQVLAEAIGLAAEFTRQI
ncbi:MAG: nickel pincer cofactor biosynthesis protein LarC [Mycobacterium sp.]